MSHLRRYYALGNIYFITNVTFDRAPILVEHIDLYYIAQRRAIERFDLQIIAWVVLPDHEHVIIDPKESNLAQVLKVCKQDFGFLYRQRMSVRSGRVWQLRYWDHIIRDREDMNRHIDYIHYNPVRHGIVGTACEYAHSSFHEYVRNGFYQNESQAPSRLDLLSLDVRLHHESQDRRWHTYLYHIAKEIKILSISSLKLLLGLK